MCSMKRPVLTSLISDASKGTKLIYFSVTFQSLDSCEEGFCLVSISKVSFHMHLHITLLHMHVPQCESSFHSMCQSLQRHTERPWIRKLRRVAPYISSIDPVFILKTHLSCSPAEFILCPPRSECITHSHIMVSRQICVGFLWRPSPPQIDQLKSGKISCQWRLYLYQINMNLCTIVHQ